MSWSASRYGARDEHDLINPEAEELIDQVTGRYGSIWWAFSCDCRSCSCSLSNGDYRDSDLSDLAGDWTFPEPLDEMGETPTLITIAQPEEDGLTPGIRRHGHTLTGRIVAGHLSGQDFYAHHRRLAGGGLELVVVAGEEQASIRTPWAYEPARWLFRAVQLLLCDEDFWVAHLRA